MRPAGDGDRVTAIEYAEAHRDEIRRIISRRLGTRLRQVYSTTDIEQSLLMALMAQHPEPLPLVEAARLVTVIAIRLVKTKARDEHHSRWEPGSPRVDIESASPVDPIEQVAAQDFLETARVHAGEDWALVEARLEGRSFVELAPRFDSTPAALRMRFRRAIDRIAEQLGGPSDE